MIAKLHFSIFSNGKAIAQTLTICCLYFLSGCEPPRPSEKEARSYFQGRYPNVIVHDFKVTKDDNEHKLRVFTITYSTAGDPTQRRVEMSYELHSITGYWVQKPKVILKNLELENRPSPSPSSDGY